MERYKTIILIEKMKKCLEAEKCEEALKIAEHIDKKKLKNMSDLSIVAECYFQNRKYQQAKELFLRMYEKNHSRRIVAQLVHLSIKLQDVESAKHYMSEFVEIAPEDFYRYIFQYSIDKMMKLPMAKLIEDLEGLKKTEYIESWAYELAKLYHKAGLKDRCVAECNDIVLWFGSGEYVERAKALRAYYLGELDVSVCEKSGISELHVMESAVTETTVTENEEFDEGEISATLAHEIDYLFEQDTQEMTEDTKEESNEEPKEESKEEPIEEQVQVTEESQQVREESEVSDNLEMEEENSVSSIDQEVEEEIYRLLEEEGIESNSEAETNLNKEEYRDKANEKNVLEIIQFDPLPNEDIIEEEALLDYFERNDISLFDLFGNYIQMEMLQKQLVCSLDQALTQKSNINIIITGEPKSGKTELAKCMAKAFCRMNLIASNQVALIDGDRLNKIDIMGSIEQLKDCILIIEHAAKMSKDTIASIQELIQELPNHIVIMLEDTRKNMDRLLRTNTAMNPIFNNRIHIDEYSLQDYMGFVYDYLTKKDYEIEKQAYTVLSNKISEVIKKEREKALPAVFSLLDSIIQKSEKRSATQLRSMSESGHFEESDFMVLKCEDIEL
ncbi:MAG: hypothetical protein PUC65_05015 [Clostridiales bacterium]|nr:hypothetical protein [Clostridiales bacterium]